MRLASYIGCSLMAMYTCRIYPDHLDNQLTAQAGNEAGFWSAMRCLIVKDELVTYTAMCWKVT